MVKPTVISYFTPIILLDFIMDRLTESISLVISQKKEMTEILTGFETKNNYRVFNPQKEELYSAEEVGGVLYSECFLKRCAPFR